MSHLLPLIGRQVPVMGPTRQAAAGPSPAKPIRPEDAGFPTRVRRDSEKLKKFSTRLKENMHIEAQSHHPRHTHTALGRRPP